MSEKSSGEPKHSSVEGQYSADQTVQELFQTCEPNQRALLSFLAVADRFELDPSPILSSLGSELPNTFRNHVNQLAEQLAEGVTPDEALNQIPGLLPANAVLALKVAREEGNLPALYSAILERTPQDDSLESSDSQTDISQLPRLAIYALIIGNVMVFILVKIVPVFWKMLQELGVEPPVEMIRLLRICDFLASFWFVGPLLAIVLLPFLVPSFRQYLRRWNPYTWRQPEFLPATNRQRALAMVTQSGLSPASRIQTILDCMATGRASKRLEKAQEKIANGEDTWKSLASENIITEREAEALAMSSNDQTQAWLLRWSASNYQFRQTRRSITRIRVFAAAIHIGLGLLVALTAVAIFMTLISIMESLY